MWDTVYAAIDPSDENERDHIRGITGNERRRLRMKVLRGKALAPKDYKAAGGLATSDPYCAIYVDNVFHGATRFISKSLDPVWSDESATFEIDLQTDSTVKIVLQDYDMFQFGTCSSGSEGMGEVQFVVGVAVQPKEPNRWFDVVPSGENSSDATGQVEVQLSYIAPRSEGPPPPPPPPPKSASLPGELKKLSPGPRVLAARPIHERLLLGVSQASLRKMPELAYAPVYLHVYDVGHAKIVQQINRVTEIGLGGIFHGAIEVHGLEQSFGGCRQQKSGIFTCKPRACPMHTYRESIYLGDCNLAWPQVKAILESMKTAWWGPTYDLLRKNCCSFSREFALELGVGEVPAWIDRLAKVGTSLDNAVHGKKEAVAAIKAESNDADDFFMEHVMASKVQRRFRAKRARRVARGEPPVKDPPKPKKETEGAPKAAAPAAVPEGKKKGGFFGGKNK